MKITDASAIVTGGASGLGAATARKLASLGAQVVIVDRNEEKGAALANEIEGITFQMTDVTDEAQVTRAIAAAEAQAPLRVAVNCAGVGWAARTVGKDGSPHEYALFKKVVGVNLIGSFNVLRLAASAISAHEKVEGERGVIINTASVAAFDGQIGQIAYAASKAGVVGMTLPAARDLSRTGIRVVTIAPGLFDTPMLAGLPEKLRESLSESVPHPARLGAVEEYASLAAHIIDNSYLNGEVIRLDGALRMAPK